MRATTSMTRQLSPETFKSAATEARRSRLNSKQMGRRCWGTLKQQRQESMAILQRVRGPAATPRFMGWRNVLKPSPKLAAKIAWLWRMETYRAACLMPMEGPLMPPVFWDIQTPLSLLIIRQQTSHHSLEQEVLFLLASWVVELNCSWAT